MTRDSKRIVGPSRRNEITFSRTYVMYLVPLALIFTALFIAAMIYLVRGILAENGEAIVVGGVCGVLSLPIVIISWWNARKALRDRQIQKKQRRSR